MGFWIFMLFCDLLIPAVMIGFGGVWKKKPPKEINGFYGYRTAMAMYICGWILLVVTIPAMLPVMKADEDTVGNVGTVLCLLQIIPLILSIVPTELALRKNFDKNGRRRRRS